MHINRPFIAYCCNHTPDDAADIATRQPTPDGAYDIAAGQKPTASGAVVDRTPL